MLCAGRGLFRRVDGGQNKRGCQMGHHYKYGCKSICNDQDIFPAMRDLVTVHQMSVKGAARFVHEDSGGKITEERARMVYRRRTGGSHDHPDKSMRKHTKEEMKIQLNDVADAIVKGEVADEDIKQVLDAAAEKVRSGEASPKVAARTANAFKSRTTDSRPPKENFVRRKTTVEMMVSSFHRATALLEEVIGKGPGSLSDGDKKTMDREFRHLIPNIFLTLDKMGVNVDSIISGLKIRIAEPPTQDIEAV